MTATRVAPPATRERAAELTSALWEGQVPEWHHRAECANYPREWWFANQSPGEIHDRWRAKLVCASCPVRELCLEEGLEDEFGIWGGLTDRERERLRGWRGGGELVGPEVPADPTLAAYIVKSFVLDTESIKQIQARWGQYPGPLNGTSVTDLLHSLMFRVPVSDGVDIVDDEGSDNTEGDSE